MKKKAADIKRSVGRTGGVLGTDSKLTPRKQRILSVLGKRFYNGLGVPEYGVRIIPVIVFVVPSLIIVE